jgi:hypothetical protein
MVLCKTLHTIYESQLLSILTARISHESIWSYSSNLNNNLKKEDISENLI